MTALLKPHRMTCESFYDGFNSVQMRIDHALQEDHFEGGFDPDNLFNVLKKCADELNVSLMDANDWNYERFFWEVWKAAERGLS